MFRSTKMGVLNRSRTILNKLEKCVDSAWNISIVWELDLFSIQVVFPTVIAKANLNMKSRWVIDTWCEVAERL